MKRIRRLIPILLLVLVACQPSPSGTPAAGADSLPTVTMGAVIRGVASTPLAYPGEVISNPATVQAQFRQPTPTPDTTHCPMVDKDLRLEGSRPESEGDLINAVVNFLNAGGDPQRLDTTLRDTWGMLDDAGFVRIDADLTGEGIPETVISLALEESSSGLMLILACADGRYAVRYQNLVEEAGPPQIIQIAEMNHDTVPDILFVFPVCEDQSGEQCNYQTQLISWEPGLGRFTNLLYNTMTYTGWPSVIDMDNDGVSELVLQLDNRGNAESGPMRTGVNIYDWDGSLYVLSIVRLDPVRYRIQIIHQADEYLLTDQPELALGLYQRALIDDELRPWRNDESAVLQAYSLYRLLLTRAVMGDQVLIEVMQQINSIHPDDTLVYAQMARVFWDAFAESNDISAACDAVLGVVLLRPEAVTLLNRYGRRSPTYAEIDLCPF